MHLACKGFLHESAYIKSIFFQQIDTYTSNIFVNGIMQALFTCNFLGLIWFTSFAINKSCVIHTCINESYFRIIIPAFSTGIVT